MGEAGADPLDNTNNTVWFYGVICCGCNYAFHIAL